jgi:predicted regulator of Ras-like GTPase activity (Roadblock/LC7/MglB family)
MPLRRLLQELVERTDGAQGAILADWEGEAVEHFSCMDDYELKVAGAHKGVILDGFRRVTGRLGGAEPQEIVISTDKTQTLVLPVNNEYFLVLILAPDSLFGRALFEARRCISCLRQEIC